MAEFINPDILISALCSMQPKLEVAGSTVKFNRTESEDIRQMLNNLKCKEIDIKKQAKELIEALDDLAQKIDPDDAHGIDDLKSKAAKVLDRVKGSIPQIPQSGRGTNLDSLEYGAITTIAFALAIMEQIEIGKISISSGLKRGHH